MGNTFFYGTLTATTLLTGLSASATAADVSQAHGRAAPVITAQGQHFVSGTPVAEIQGRTAPVSGNAIGINDKTRVIAEKLMNGRPGRV